MRKIREAAEKRKGKPAWNRGRNDYLTEKHLKKMRQPKSEEHKLKLRGKKKSKEHVEKILKSRNESKARGEWSHPTIKIVQIDKNDKEIKVWRSITEASNNLKIKISDISRVCKGIGKTCGGYKWKYYE